VSVAVVVSVVDVPVVATTPPAVRVAVLVVLVLVPV
jgi:hypothetical protein